MPGSLSILMPVFNELLDGRARDRRRPDRRASRRVPPARARRRRVDRRHARAAAESRAGRTNVTFVLHDRNRGKGAALQTGLQHATGDWSAVLDADLEYRAADLGPLLEPLLSGEARVVFGTRSWASHAALQLLVRHRQQGRDVRDERDLQLLDLRRDDLPQGDVAQSSSARSASASGGSRSSRRSPRA